jgi:hypothetical protein
LTYKVFLSHSHLDEPLARLIKSEVETAVPSVQLYLAQDDPKPGTPLAAKVLANIRTSDALLVLLTERSQSASWVHQEIGAAAGNNKLVVPLVERGADTSRLGLLSGMERINLDPDDLPATTTSLASFLRQKANIKERIDAIVLGALALLVGVWMATSQDSK